MAKSKSRPLRAVVRFSEDSQPVPQWVYREMCMIFADAIVEWANNKLEEMMQNEERENKRKHINELHRREYAKRKGRGT